MSFGGVNETTLLLDCIKREDFFLQMIFPDVQTAAYFKQYRLVVGSSPILLYVLTTIRALISPWELIEDFTIVQEDCSE